MGEIGGKRDKNKLTESKITQVLDWSYEKVADGLIGMETAYELANKYIYKQ